MQVKEGEAAIVEYLRARLSNRFLRGPLTPVEVTKERNSGEEDAGDLWSSGESRACRPISITKDQESTAQASTPPANNTRHMPSVNLRMSFTSTHRVAFFTIKYTAAICPPVRPPPRPVGDGQS